MRLQGGIFDVPDTITSTNNIPLPGIDTFLSLLRMEGVTLYAVTDGSRIQAQQTLAQAGLSAQFHGILSTVEQGCPITSTVLYEKAARRMGTAPKVTAVFTTRPNLLPQLQESGFFTVFIGNPCAQQPAADLIISDYRSMSASSLD